MAENLIEPHDSVQINPSEVKIEMNDIQDEFDFSNYSIVCYVVGANPPLSVLEGFVNRVWRNVNVDKVAVIRNGVYIVKFTTMECRDKMIAGHYFLIISQLW